MKILIASDKFKGSLSAKEACEAISSGIKAELVEIKQIPVADGGDGMARTLTEAMNGLWIETKVQNSLGIEVSAGFGLFDQGKTAAIEMAEASGIAKMGNQSLDPWVASTYGTGQLIREAMKRGVSKIILGIGGSATNDGGSGMAEALGYQFFDKRGHPVENLPLGLSDVVRINPPADLDGFPEVIVACDVSNTLLGPNGCTQIYGPQKGIKAADFERHEERLAHLVALTPDPKMAGVAGSGAAGGLGFGAMSFLKGRLEPGFALISKVLDLEAAVLWADLVITGEGKIDDQSLQGKAPYGVAQLAKKQGKPVVAFCGVRESVDNQTIRQPDSQESLNIFDRIWEINRGELSITQAIQRGFTLLEETARAAGPELVELAGRRQPDKQTTSLIVSWSHGLIAEACPFLPEVEAPLRASAMKICGSDRGRDFYLLALRCAQSLWLQGFTAQALLLLNRAFGADHASDPAMCDHAPLPYAAVAWIMHHRQEAEFMGNPRRHYQHLATRMVEPRKELRAWRAWACWHIACRIFPDLSADKDQIRKEGVTEPSFIEISNKLQSLGLPGEAGLWQSVANSL